MGEMMTALTRPDRLRKVALLVGVSGVSLLAATVIVGYLQDTLGVPNPSAVYIVAVVITALASGTVGAVITSVAAFLLYNYLFTEPRYTLSMHEPGVWLSVVLLLFVGIVVGQLAASMRSRAETGRIREREARALFRLSRALATRTSTDVALGEISAILHSETSMDSVWISLGPETAERAVASAGAESAPSLGAANPVSAVVSMLRRTPGDEPAKWIKVHQAGGRSGEKALESYRVRIEATDAPLGSLWALRERGLGQPDATETRLLSAAADQVGQALMQDRFALESQAA
jgi:K+-sensing histidine kinase KdpD